MCSATGGQSREEGDKTGPGDPALPEEPERDFLPRGFFSQEQNATFRAAVADIRGLAVCRTRYSRHGGAHRTADRPMGGVLVALCLKHADSVTKTIATTGAIVLTTLVNAAFLDGPMSLAVATGVERAINLKLATLPRSLSGRPLRRPYHHRPRRVPTNTA